MSTLAGQRQSRSLFPELPELFAGFPSMARLRPAFGTRAMRLEDELDDGSYVNITVRDGQLTIQAERSDEKDFNGRSEFSYGSFVRSVSLPEGADENDIKAAN